MTRIRKQGVELTPWLEICLTVGLIPVLEDQFTDEDLEVGWAIHGKTIMEGWEKRRGSRPWGWWTFETEEGPPPLEPGAQEIRLAELGELTEEEYADLRDHADKARELIESGKHRGYISTGGGRRHDLEQEAVDLWERVCEIQQNGSDSPSPK